VEDPELLSFYPGPQHCERGLRCCCRCVLDFKAGRRMDRRINTLSLMHQNRTELLTVSAHPGQKYEILLLLEVLRGIILWINFKKSRGTGVDERHSMSPNYIQNHRQRSLTLEAVPMCSSEGSSRGVRPNGWTKSTCTSFPDSCCCCCCCERIDQAIFAPWLFCVLAMRHSSMPVPLSPAFHGTRLDGHSQWTVAVVVE
jgi:hypothetical protein